MDHKDSLLKLEETRRRGQKTAIQKSVTGSKGFRNHPDDPNNPNKVRERYLQTIRSLIKSGGAGQKHLAVPGPVQVSNLAVTDKGPHELLTVGRGDDETPSLSDDCYHCDALARA